MNAASRPSVSIVLATHNRRDWLRLAMDSVLQQSYPDLELLVMDDGSTDGTPEILKKYSRRHPLERFRFSRHDNMGQARTLNRGYEMARGDILGYLSDDDLLVDGAISRLVAELVAHPDAVAAYPGYRMIDENGDVVDTVRPIEYSPVEAYRLHDTIIGPGGLVRREVLESSGAWDPSLHWMGDLILWMRVGMAGPVVRVPDPLAYWRRHPGGITIQTSRDRAREHLRLVRLGDSVLGLGADATEVHAEALRNACITAAFFGGDPGGTDPSRFMSIDLQRPQISASGAGLGQSETLDERAAEATALWRELARLVVRVGEVRTRRGRASVPVGGGLESARRRLEAVQALPGDGQTDPDHVSHADFYLALRYAAIDCATDASIERSRYLLIDRQVEPFSEEELEVLTRNAFHSSIPELERVIARYRHEIEAASDRSPG